MKLWLITVNFGNTEPTRLLLKDLPNYNSKLITIGIADNNSTLESKSKLENIFNKLSFESKLYPFKKNLFYWPAAKKVIDHLYKKKKEYPDWILICNNDIIFTDKDFFKKLEKINPKDFPIIGPDITNQHGDHLNPFMVHRLNKLKMFFWNLYFISYRLSIVMLNVKKIINLISLSSKQISKEKKKKIYSIHGSAILLSSYFFKSGGWLDDDFDLYGEEISLSEIANKINLPIYYFPSLKIKHNEHSNTKNSDKKYLFLKARESYKYVKKIYFKK